MKRVKEAVEKFGDPRKESIVLRQHLGEAQRRMEEFRAVLEIADAEQQAAQRSRTAESAQWKN
jgi:hypothetical protein